MLERRVKSEVLMAGAVLVSVGTLAVDALTKKSFDRQAGAATPTIECVADPCLPPHSPNAFTHATRAKWLYQGGVTTEIYQESESDGRTFSEVSKYFCTDGTFNEVSTAYGITEQGLNPRDPLNQQGTPYCRDKVVRPSELSDDSYPIEDSMYSILDPYMSVQDDFYPEDI